MIIIFAVFLAALALYAQKWYLEKCLDSVKEDHWMDKAIVEQDETFHIVLSLKNTGRGFVPYLKVSEWMPHKMQLKMEGANVSQSPQGTQVSYTTWLRPRQEVQKYLPVSAPERGR